MRLHLLTLNWQGKDKMQELYASLLPELVDIDYKWVIKDNCSTDGSIEEIESWNNEHITLIKHPHNRDSYSQGMNLLYKTAAPADDDLVLTLNNDIVFFGHHNSIKNMMKLMDNKSVGLVGAKLNYKNTTLIQHSGVLFHPANGFPYHYRTGEEETDFDRKNREYPIVTGAVTLTRASLFNNKPYPFLSEEYFWAFEDCDMAMMINHTLKKKVVCCGETNIYHEESASLKKNPVNKLFMSKNLLKFKATWDKFCNKNSSALYDKNPNHKLFNGK